MDSFLQTFNDSESSSLRKQSTFRKPLLVPSRKGRLRNDCRNSILVKRHYSDLGSSSD